jgi:acyl-CoA reductase-like NAD-dependent aldehyde dehydrogenase
MTTTSKHESTSVEIDSVVEQSRTAAHAWACSGPETRAALLRGLASAIEHAQPELVALADEETFLGAARLNGEVARTAFQLRAFADQVESKVPYQVIDDPAVAGAPPVGHPSMVRVRVPLGPVAMFAASNFPFAFSVLGGDTASALAAGCPVVVKAHPGHPRLSRRVHEISQGVLVELGLPLGILGMVEGGSVDVGLALIRHPSIAAAAFTGSTRGGIALQAEANARPRPIPFYGELGSINPIVVLPEGIAGKEIEMATMLAQSITNGTGQFCTSPGVLIVMPSVSTGTFLNELVGALKAQKTHVMLTPGMRKAFDNGVQGICARAGLSTLLRDDVNAESAPRPYLGRVSAKTFIQDRQLHEEIFGPAALVVDVNNAEEVTHVLEAIGGSLTVTVWGASKGTSEEVAIVRSATQIAGRVLFSGVPTGVAVTAAQHHGGPFPASTQPSTTSVGYAALERFLRPVALQDAPAWLLSQEGRPI